MILQAKWLNCKSW